MRKREVVQGRNVLPIILLTGFLSVLLTQPMSELDSKSGAAEIQIEPAFPNLSFARPVDLQFADDDTNRLFVVEQAGRIIVFANDPAVEASNVFLDIRSRVNDSGNEEGLLGLAFHPNYRQNRLFYVYYSATGRERCPTSPNDRCTRISRFVGSAGDPNAADPGSESLILEVPQPYSNHNGGQIRFGPDGYLYVGVGDGGSAGDPSGNGQNRGTLLASILRIDVDNPENGLAYGIPPDNPFVNTSFRPEIYAYGLRNPWRFSFDEQTGELWVGDVGQNLYEEVDIVVKGGNYGWNVMEGDHCYKPSTGCNQTGLELPVWTYQHGSSTGRSIAGGFVYRGSRVKSLIGAYVYADFTSGRIWSLRRQGSDSFENSLLIESGQSISSFGVDRDHELYFCSFSGKIYHFVDPGSTGSLDEIPTSPPARQEIFPNPLLASGSIQVTMRRAGPASLQIFDALGRRVQTVWDGYLDGGTHTFPIELGRWAPGTYLCRLVTAGGAYTNKIVVL